jgi:hypothetical protein
MSLTKQRSTFKSSGYGNFSSLGSANIGSLNWATLSGLTHLAEGMDLEELKTHLIPFRQNYVLPQLMAFLASNNFKLIRNEDNKVSISKSLKAWSASSAEGQIKFNTGEIATKEVLSGIFAFLRVSPRSAILPDKVKQVAPEWLRYSACVPLFLSAFKEFRGLKYSEWDFSLQEEMEGLSIVLDKNMFEIVDWIESDISMKSSDILAIRNFARVYQSGAKMGQLRSLNQTYSIPAIRPLPRFPELTENLSESTMLHFNESYPAYVKLLMCQTWLYQPPYYTDLAIHNLTDPDSPAEPLIDTTILSTKSKETVTRTSSTYDW